MISQTFSQISDISCAIYCNVSLNIAMGYCIIVDTTSTMFLRSRCVLINCSSVYNGCHDIYSVGQHSALFITVKKYFNAILAIIVISLLQ